MTLLSTLEKCPQSRDFSGDVVVKNLLASAGDGKDVGLIPGFGRSPGEGIGSPLQCSWSFLVARMVKNPPSMWETWVRSLGWEDPLEEGMATHSSILAWRVPTDRGGWQAIAHGVTKSWT